MFGFKKINVPKNSETKEVVVVKLWYVTWHSRHGEYSTSISKEIEAFPNKNDALLFKKGLESAFALVRHTSNVHVGITEKNYIKK